MLAVRFLLEPLAKGAFLTERVPEFVLFEPFAYIAGGTRAENFGEALVGDVPEGYLPAVIEAAGDHPAIVQDGCMRIEGMACPGGVSPCVAQQSRRGKGVYMTRRPFKAGIFVDV